MRHVVHDKYFLKDLFREIDLFDRKLEHLRHHENFESPEERDRAVRTTTTRRSTLIAKAHMLIGEGIEYDQADFPRSMLTPEQLDQRRMGHDAAAVTAAEPPPEETVPSATAEEPTEASASASPQTEFGAAIARLQEQAKTAGMPRAGWQQELMDYKRKRNKIPA